jgi:5-formyltetrahydrofolate cyclo-ligase
MTLDKKAARTEALALRAKISPAEADAFAQRLARIGPELARAHGATAVSAFASIGDEIATGPLLAALHAAGFVVGLPITGKIGTPLSFRRWTPETRMVEGRMRIPEPPADAAPVVPDVLFVPLAAFDRRGHRIGYGAGFYDRTLAALRAEKDVVAIGVAYAGQEVLFVPNDDHDEPLDMIVTEKDTILTADAA